MRKAKNNFRKSLKEEPFTERTVIRVANLAELKVLLGGLGEIMSRMVLSGVCEVVLLEKKCV